MRRMGSSGGGGADQACVRTVACALADCRAACRGIAPRRSRSSAGCDLAGPHQRLEYRNQLVQHQSAPSGAVGDRNFRRRRRPEPKRHILGPTTIQALQFNSGAQQYFFDIGICGCQEFHITGTGITNLSSFQPMFTVRNLLFFENASTAGNASITNRFGGETVFTGTSTAGNALITNRFNGQTFFADLSSAGDASIVNRFQGAT
jgi:hypothetical protein